jgi:hypothetical protein
MERKLEHVLKIAKKRGVGLEMQVAAKARNWNKGEETVTKW